MVNDKHHSPSGELLCVCDRKTFCCTYILFLLGQNSSSAPTTKVINEFKVRFSTRYKEQNI